MHFWCLLENQTTLSNLKQTIWQDLLYLNPKKSLSQICKLCRVAMHAFSKPLNRFSRNLRWGLWKEETYVHNIYRAKHAEPKIKLTWYFDTVSSFAGEWLVAVSKVVSLSLSQKGPFKDILWLEDVNIQGTFTPLSKHAIFWHLDFGELTYPRSCGRHYIYFHLWGLRLLEENTRGPSLKQEAPRLWDKTSHHLNHSQRKEIL